MLCSDCGSDVCSADLLLQDATRGLLAPNNASGAGAGFVSYSVRPSDDVATGAGISASARVLMDGFAPEDMRVISQTVDGEAPESRVSAARIPGTDGYRDNSWVEEKVRHGEEGKSVDTSVSLGMSAGIKK